MSRNWKKATAPAGAYVSWGESPGQAVEGEVTAYSATGGTDVSGEKCPQLQIRLSEPAESVNKTGVRTKFAAGESVVLNLAQASLKRSVLATPPAVGNFVRIEMLGVVSTKSGNSVKEFDFFIDDSNSSVDVWGASS